MQLNFREKSLSSFWRFCEWKQNLLCKLFCTKKELSQAVTVTPDLNKLSICSVNDFARSDYATIKKRDSTHAGNMLNYINKTIWKLNDSDFILRSTGFNGNDDFENKLNVR